MYIFTIVKCLFFSLGLIIQIYPYEFGEGLPPIGSYTPSLYDADIMSSPISADVISSGAMFDLPNSVIAQKKSIAEWHMKFPDNHNSGTFEFLAQGRGDLNFFVGTETSSPLCDVVLWAWGNSASAIRRNSSQGSVDNVAYVKGSRLDFETPVSIKVTIDKLQKRLIVQTKKQTDADYPSSDKENNPEAARIFMSYTDQDFDKAQYRAIAFSSWGIMVRWKRGEIISQYESDSSKINENLVAPTTSSGGVKVESHSVKSVVSTSLPSTKGAVQQKLIHANPVQKKMQEQKAKSAAKAAVVKKK